MFYQIPLICLCEIAHLGNLWFPLYDQTLCLNLNQSFGTSVAEETASVHFDGPSVSSENCYLLYFVSIFFIFFNIFLAIFSYFIAFYWFMHLELPI